MHVNKFDLERVHILPVNTTCPLDEAYFLVSPIFKFSNFELDREGRCFSS